MVTSEPGLQCLSPPVRLSLPHTLLCIESAPASLQARHGSVVSAKLTGANGFQRPEKAIPATDVK